MAKITRREFLLSLAALPLVKLAAPIIMPPRTISRPYRQTQPGADKPNILVMVFDALSARDISLFGYRRETTPNLARLAEKATVFHNHYAGANFTSPGTSSLLMGLYPWSHRSLHYFSHPTEAMAHHNIFNFLPDDYYKLAYTHNSLASAVLYQFQDHMNYLKPRRELTLSDSMWGDVVFPNDYPVFTLAERQIGGLGNRPPTSTIFSAIDLIRTGAAAKMYKDDYAKAFPLGLPGDLFPSHFLLEDAIDWVADLNSQVANPYFAYVHLYPPHQPYNTRAEFVDIFDDGWMPAEKEKNVVYSEDKPDARLYASRKAYDEYIAYVDAEFGRLFAMLEQSGALENTYVILTSDHGELFERGIVGHGFPVLYDPVVHVPLMVWKPGQQQRADVFERTSCVDVLPTMLQITGQPIPETCEGIVLPTFSDAAANPGERSIFSVEGKLNNAHAPLTIATYALYKGPYKLIGYNGYKELSSEGEKYELFDLENDPDELDNLFETRSSIGQELKDEMKRKIVEVNEPYRR